jgi:hypothetical protein
VVVSVQIAELGARGGLAALLRRPDPDRIAGLGYAETALTAGLGGRMPRPGLGRVAMISVWEDEEALDRFSSEHPAANRFRQGWEVRLEPLRVYGAWPAMPGLPERELPVDDEEPVAVLTLGRLRLRRAPSFLRTGAPAESEVVREPDLLAGTGLARPPHLVSTFSVWRTAAAMRDYAIRESGAHRAAVESDRAKPFHHESAFVRFRPLSSRGSWGGRDPLAEAIGSPAIG